MKNTAIAIFIGSLAGGLVVSPVGAARSTQCDCDYEAKRVSRAHAVAWSKAHQGIPLSDAELQAFSDAQQILECVAR